MNKLFLVLGGLLIMSNLMLRWKLPEKAKQYKTSILEAENKYKLPHNLLARVLYQESRYRPDIISGETKSSAGAVGIAQIVPKWHPDVNPYNPYESIDYAAKYLRELKNQFGDWSKALGAYNWGPGNLRKYLKGQTSNMPMETQRYIKEITSDVF